MKKRIQGSLPSAAVIIAVIALVAALAGGAEAGKKKVKKVPLSRLTAAAQTQTVGVGPLHYVFGQTIIISPGATLGATVLCPEGTNVIGGGIETSLNVDELTSESHPIRSVLGLTGWHGDVFNKGSLSRNASAFAICATSKAVQGKDTLPMEG